MQEIQVEIKRTINVHFSEDLSEKEAFEILSIAVGNQEVNVPDSRITTNQTKSYIDIKARKEWIPVKQTTTR